MSNSRKRQRLETVTAGDFEFADDDVDNVGSITTTSAAGLSINASLAGHSIFLTQSSASSNNSNAGLGNIVPANVFLTICDDISDDEAEPEYLLDSSELEAHIKQEQDVSTQTQTTLPLQYRIVNRLQHEQLQLEADNTNMPIEEISAQSPTLLPAAMQLPSGCEIYLVKEYVGARTGNNELLAAANAASSNRTSSSASSSNRSAAIVKLEADTQTTAAGTSSSGSNAALRFRGNATASLTSTKAAAPAAPLSTAAGTAVAQSKRSFILETYKKRDDKRRATHNEVERRRRDKINSWIFKLKEMLPAEATQCNSNNNSTAASVAGSSSSDCVTTNEQQSHGNNSNSQNSANSRTPPNDSKSQILIKACEYIKAMQDEIKSLRECLSENENLRSCNQRLQSELNKLKRKSDECAYSNSNMLNNSSNNHNSSNNNNSGIIRNNNNPNSTLNLTLNTLNRNGLFGSNALQMTPSTAANALGRLGTDTGAVHNLSPTTYAKRELIIRDYVD